MTWLGSLAILAAVCACSDSPQAPSVVLVSIDTLRADHTGWHGYGRDTTPFLDRLARESLVFENAFTPSPWTLVSHMTMLTGLHPRQHGVLEADLQLHPEVPLLAERLRAAGYRTLGLYFHGWLSPRHGFDRGFEVFRQHDDAEQARAHWREELPELRPERPFFLFLHLFDVHSDPIGPLERPLYFSPPPYQDFFLADATQRLAHLSAREIWDGAALGPDEVEALVAHYDGGVRHVDARLEELFGDLSSRGLLENTLVVVTADHGEALTQRGALRSHGGFYQEGLHVPLLVRTPDGRRAGERELAPVQLADIVPTVLDLVGLPDPRLPGRSLLRPIPDGRTIVGGFRKTRYLVQWPIKYGLRETAEEIPRYAFRVDLGDDPEELAPERLDVAAFATRWDSAWQDMARFPSPPSIGGPTDEEERELRALGYGGELDAR